MVLQNVRAFLLFLLMLSITSKRARALPLDAAGSEFIILHNNDMHARFEQTSVNGNTCGAADAASKNCYGGFARTAHEIRKFREEAKKPGGTPVLYLNAGDTYTGTPWFYLYRDNIVSEFMNVLQPDAISLGNHEFDDGIKGLAPFLNRASFPVLAANVDFSKFPELAASKSLMPSTIIEVNGTKVGIIGYLTSNIPQYSTEKIEFIPEVAAINKEAELLKNQGVTIIIALGHSGYATDKDIAMNCPLVDLVIGGHSHTFLYTGPEPSIEVAEGPYPTVIRQASGKDVPVVQAYVYSKYLGYLKLKFDSKGNLQQWDGKPILLNAIVPEDSDVLKLLDAYRPGVDALQKEVVGHSKVILDGSALNCREKECNLGNMITDSMVYARTLEYNLESDDFWTDAAIAFIRGADIRTSIPIKEEGITRSDVIEVVPYGSELVMAEVSGKTITNMLELSVSKLGSRFVGFLQMSGVHVEYSPSEPIGSRVKSVRVLCAKCNIPRYSDLEDQKSYNIIVTNYMLTGGDGYMVPTLSTPKMLNLDISEAVAAYIKAKTPVYPGIEWRITFDGDVTDTTTATTPSTTTPKDGGAVNLSVSGILILPSLLLNYLR